MAMIDPYRVLGVSQSATDAEITAAYRRLAKKYHPDLHPGDRQAEEKMKELNAAYDQIKKWRSGEEDPSRAYGNPYGGNPYGNPYGGAQGYGGFGGFEDFFGGRQRQQQGGGTTQEQAVRNFINYGQYQQALRVLSEMENRGAEWFYYSAVANAGIGNSVTAINHAQEAVRMDPNNAAYQQLLSQLQQGGTVYRQRGTGYGFDMNGVGRTMMQLCLAQAACMFCCRPC